MGNAEERERIFRNILLEQSLHQQVIPSRPPNLPNAGENYFTHVDVFPIIADIIEKHSTLSNEYMSHEEIVEAMLSNTGKSRSGRSGWDSSFRQACLGYMGYKLWKT